MKRTPQHPVRYRSAETGGFVTKQFADSHPKTTVKEKGPHKKK